tara:strand:+ start:578 stop:766 length:189 start_codon:yes stop_codon:yes gene_type:complete
VAHGQHWNDNGVVGFSYGNDWGSLSGGHRSENWQMPLKSTEKSKKHTGQVTLPLFLWFIYLL